MSKFDLFSTLERCGKSLTSLLGEAKSKHKTTETPIHNRVETTITGLIDDLKLSKDGGEFTIEECFVKVVKKVEWTLEELTKHDAENASKYRDLANRLGTFVSTFSRNLATSASTHKNKNKNKNKNNNNNDSVNDNDIINIENTLSSIDLSNGQQILFALFTVLPQGTEVKKNDLFRCWFSVTKIDDPKTNLKLDFEEELKTLVDIKVIEQVTAGVGNVRINNKREGVKYIMPNIIWSKFQDNIVSYEKFRISKHRIVANTDACNLSAKRLNSLTTSPDFPDEVMVLQLGSWNYDPTMYIVVEDEEALAKAFKKIFSTRFLNLQGVSGIVNLPSLAIMASVLKVLNLKGCHNLEYLQPPTLPSQFSTLRNWELGYLDISECYLLDHPPDAFGGCSKLRVLKGFILPKEPSQNPFISNPLQFVHLWKLTLRTKRLNFPTNSDLETLCELQSLTNLKITWVGACSDNDNQDVQFDINSKLPPKLTKFEMETASDSTSTKILDLIARQKESSTIPLEKLYIKGGNLSKIDQNVDCKVLRLQYLPNMQHSCYDMMRTFPKLHRLEMSKDVMYSMLRQSFQKATGTNDQNSGWEPSFTHNAAPSSTS